MMSVLFPSREWLGALHEKLNTDGHYNSVARHWEGDLFFDIRPEGNLVEAVSMYLDLWHGVSRRVEYGATLASLPRPKFILTAQYGNFAAVLLGKLDAMTAMMTSKLRVDGNLGYMMRHVPTVLDFVRCAREVTARVL